MMLKLKRKKYIGRSGKNYYILKGQEFIDENYNGKIYVYYYTYKQDMIYAIGNYDDSWVNYKRDDFGSGIWYAVLVENWDIKTKPKFDKRGKEICP